MSASQAIRAACLTLRSLVRDIEDEHDEKVRHAYLHDEEPPAPDLPRASNAFWVRWAANKLRDHDLPDWFSHAAFTEAWEDLTAAALEKLRGWPEFATIATVRFDLRWTPKRIAIKDLLSTEPRAGRVKVVPVGDRLAWEGEGDAPMFRLELSLPWWLLATEDEIERGLHDLLASCGMRDEDKPVIRKPDIHAHASTLARFGVSGVREASAVFHAQRHPSHERLLRDFGFDPITGQGSLWEHTEPRQGNLSDLARQVRRAAKRLSDAGVTVSVTRDPSRAGKGEDPSDDLPEA